MRETKLHGIHILENEDCTVTLRLIYDDGTQVQLLFSKEDFSDLYDNMTDYFLMPDEVKEIEYERCCMRNE